jgi:hypothetical protein
MDGYLAVILFAKKGIPIANTVAKPFLVTLISFFFMNKKHVGYNMFYHPK